MFKVSNKDTRRTLGVLPLWRKGKIRISFKKPVQKKAATWRLRKLEAVARRCSVRKGILRNFAKFTGKRLCQSLLFNKVVGLRPATLFKKRLGHRCSPVNLAKFLRTPFLTEHLRWLLREKLIVTRNFIKDNDF